MPPTDEQLAAAAAQGDLAAYDALMERYQRLVFKVAHGFTGDHDDALDVVQSVFVKVFRQLRRFRGQSAFKTWLLRIALNESRSWRRAERRLGERQAPFERAAGHAAQEPSPESAALQAERRARLLRRLRGLNRRHATAVALRYFDGLRISEIATVLGCNEMIVRNMLFRSVRRLRTELTEDFKRTP